MAQVTDEFKEILKKRCRHLSKAVSLKGYEAMLLTDASNVRYFTGFSGHDSWALIVGPRVYLVTDSRYSEQAEGECPTCSIINRKGSIIDEIAKILARCRSVKALAVEEEISLKAYNGLKKKTKVRIRPVSGIIEKLRMIKSLPEVKSIIVASEIASKAVSNALKTLRVGITESELAGRIEFEMRILGSAASFDTIVAFGANGSRPHHYPGQTRLRENDVILIDFGAVYDGYCSDMTRCYAVGRVSEKYRKAYEAVKNAQAAGIAAIKPGLGMDVPDAAAREQIKNAGFPQYGHGTGHGLGLDVHEYPSISKLCKQKLEVGQVLTVEPGIYLPGQFGIRIEDDILVTETGCKVLTREVDKSPELQVLEL